VKKAPLLISLEGVGFFFDGKGRPPALSREIFSLSLSLPKLDLRASSSSRAWSLARFVSLRRCEREKGGDFAKKSAQKIQKEGKKGTKKPYNTHLHTHSAVFLAHAFIPRERTHGRRERNKKKSERRAPTLFLPLSLARARWTSVQSVRRSSSSSCELFFFFSLGSQKYRPFLKKAWAQVLEKVSRFTRDLRRASIRRRGKKRNERNKRASSFRLRLFLPPEIDANVANA